jgi:hypothetical protein
VVRYRGACQTSRGHDMNRGCKDSVYLKYSTVVPFVNWACDFKICYKLSRHKVTLPLLRDIAIGKLYPLGDLSS